jgi:hypothetical protein
MNRRAGPFHELFRIFRRHLVESDALAVDADYETKLWQILGILAAPGLYSVLLIDMIESDPLGWEARGFRTFFAAFSFIVAAATTLFEWDMLFPDRRDFLILTQFPIRMRDLFVAKVASLGALIGTLVVALNAGSVSMFALALILSPRAHHLSFLKLALAFMACNAAAALFGFLCVATLQALLVNLTSVRLFRRISPYIQTTGMSLMVLALVLAPIYVNVKLVRAFRPEWLWYFPPYWFAAMQEPLTPRSDPLFRPIAIFGLHAFAYVFLLCAAAWALGFTRHYRRTLEADDSIAGRVRRHSWADTLLASPQERGIYRFTGAILARSNKHRMFLACYWSLGIGLGIVAGLTLDIHGFSFSRQEMRSFPFLLTFFIVSGLRTVFQFPAELNANWLFQMAEDGWGRAARRATRIRILSSGLVPALALFLPFEIANWGVTTGLLHVSLECLSGLLLAEIMFWTFDRVPFTCSYFPGRMNLGLLAALYLYGFTTYSFRMAAMEQWIEQNPVPGAGLMLASVVALGLVWRWKTDTEMIRFDGTEPELQTLDLT